MLKQADKGGQCLTVDHPLFFVLERKRSATIKEAARVTRATTNAHEAIVHSLFFYQADTVVLKSPGRAC